MSFCVSMPHFTNIGSFTAEIWREIWWLSRWRPLWHNLTFVSHFFQKVNVCQHTKYFRPYWNSSSGFDFDHMTVIRTMPVFCIKLPNFIYIGPPNAEIWRYIDFWRWRPRQFNTISGFLLVNAAVFGRSKYISKPNFVDISQFKAEI